MSLQLYMSNGKTVEEYVKQLVDEGITKAITNDLTVERVYDEIRIKYKGELISWDYLPE